MWKPLAKLMTSHFDATIQFENWADIWEEKRLIWDQIMENLRQQEAGTVYGTYETFQAFRFIESLAIDEDIYLRLAAALLSAPLSEDFANYGGFLNAVEGFFLKQYGRAPEIHQGKHTNRVLIRFPKFKCRILSGFPSPRKFKRDFQILVSGLWGVVFAMKMDGDIFIVEGYFPEGNLDEPHNPAFVKAGKRLLDMAAEGA
jgi:hypothetical protein